MVAVPGEWNLRGENDGFRATATLEQRWCCASIHKAGWLAGESSARFSRKKAPGWGGAKEQNRIAPTAPVVRWGLIASLGSTSNTRKRGKIKQGQLARKRRLPSPRVRTEKQREINADGSRLVRWFRRAENETIQSARTGSGDCLGASSRPSRATARSLLAVMAAVYSLDRCFWQPRRSIRRKKAEVKLDFLRQRQAVGAQQHLFVGSCGDRPRQLVSTLGGYGPLGLAGFFGNILCSSKDERSPR